MKFAIGRWHKIFYPLPTLVYLTESPKMIGITWLWWYVGFDEKEKESN